MDTEYKGIITLANDKYLENFKAFYKSLRRHTEIPILLYKYDQDCDNLQRYCDDNLIKILEPDETQRSLIPSLEGLFGKNFFRNISNFKKLYCFTSPVNNFLYSDCDIVFNSDPEPFFNELRDYDFIFCDNQYKNGVEYLYKKVPEDIPNLKNTFNAGLWASTNSKLGFKSILSELKRFVGFKDYYDFSKGTTDMGIINHLILSSTLRCKNLIYDKDFSNMTWAGNPDSEFLLIKGKLYSSQSKELIRYIHWAGKKVRDKGTLREFYDQYLLEG